MTGKKIAFLLSVLLGIAATAAIAQTQYWRIDGSWSKPTIPATSAAVGGSLLIAGGCQSSNLTVAGATTSMAVTVSPATDPGNSVQWQAFVSAADTVTIRVCAIVAATPASTVYNVKVLQ